MGILDGNDSYEPMDKFLAPTATAGSSLSLPETIIHGAVATIADVGTTYWNTLTPEKYEASTADLLGRIDQDALQVYNEHPDAIKTASFVTGLVAPIGLSIKGMSMLRAGNKGFSWFSEAGQAANLAKVEEAFAASKGTIDSAYIAAKWQLYRGIAYNAVADNIAAEVAIMGTMSAHPFMEDYYKDFSSNFLKSVAFGTGIQTGLGTIIAKGQITAKTAAIEMEGNKIIKETLWDPLVAASISPRSHIGELAAVHLQNLDNLKAIVSKANDTNDAFTLKPFTIARLEKTILEEEATMASRLVEAAQGPLKEYLDTASKETKEYFMNFVGQVGNAHLDKIGFAEVKGTTGKLAEGAAVAQIKIDTSLFETVMKTLKGSKEEVAKTVKTDAIYVPWALEGTGAYISKADAPYYLTVADLGKTVEGLDKAIDQRWGKLPLSDWAIEAAVHPTAQLDGEFAQAMLWAEKLDADKFNKIVVDPDHLPLLKALHVRALKLMEENPTLVLNLKVTKEAPSFEAVQRVALARKGGVPATYVSDLAELSKKWDDFSLYHPKQNWDPKTGISSTVHRNLDNWVHGEYAFFRNGASLYRGLIKNPEEVLTPVAYKNLKEASDILDTLYHNPRSKALRDSFRQMADADGNVWLYRGMHVSPKGHQTLESYTTLPDKAAEFGRSSPTAVKMYKVHVDDIVATVHDFGNGYKPEILAFPPTRDWYQISKSNLRELPDELVIDMPKTVTVGSGSTATVTSLQELETTINSAQLNLVKDLQNRGYGIETIALKTGTPEETIVRILETGQVEGAGLIKYASKLDVEQALDVTKRSLALSTDMNKVLQPEIFSKLNDMNLENTSNGILEMYMLSSQSELVQKFGQALLSDDIKILTKQLYQHLPNITSSQLKSSMFASTNQVLEGLGPVGAIVNTIGKEMVQIKNALKETFEEPIASLMGQIIKSGEATIIEANTALNVNASISGRRFYKGGSFWVPHADVSLGEMRQMMKLGEKEFLEAVEQVPELATKALLNGSEYTVSSPAVRELLERLQNYGREMYEFKNTYSKAVGRQELADIGFWAPSFNPRNKSIAYVHDRLHNTTSMLYADSDELLATGIKNYEDALMKKHGAGWKQQFQVVPKSDQEAYNLLAGRHDSLYMQAADLTKQHGGSSAATVVSTDTSIFKDLLQGYQEHVNNGVERIMEMQLNTTMNALKNLSDTSLGLYSETTKGVLQKLSSKPVDVGQTIRNVLLGRPLLSEHKAWSELQQRGQVYTDLALKNITEIFQPILGKQTVRSADEWTRVLQDMESKGIVNPFENLDKEFGLGRYLSEGQSGNQALTPRAIALGNGLAATFLLRVAELAQPLVNALSLPILTSAAVNRKLSSSFMGATLDPSAKFSVVSSMYDGIRLMNHPTEGMKWSKIGESKGLFNIELRNVTELLEHQRSLDPGVLTTVEKAIESQLVKTLSKPADLSESFVRRASFFTGVNMAKKAYPGLSDTGVMVFARNFMDEAVGNYTAAQRPAMFQGTFGVAMGLFQTYMLTMAQAMYRQVQHRDWASLGKMLLTQGTVFGASSLPGFHLVSEQIGKSFSDQHIDLETGTFRAIDDPMASMLLYGVPSSIGPGVTTRGDIQPRIPNPTNLSSLALVNLTGQAYTAAERVATAAFHADENAGRAMLEAISLQSISRPVARVSELLSGRAITSRGDIVSQGSELYSVQGVISRVMATRPLQEIKAREAMHLNTVYGQADSEKRKGVTSRLKSHIRNGDLDGDKLDTLASEYLRTGTTTGWRAAVNDAVRQAGQEGNATTLGKLKKGSPLNSMLEDLD